MNRTTLGLSDHLSRLAKPRQLLNLDDAPAFVLALLVGSRLHQEGLFPAGMGLAALSVPALWHQAHPEVGEACAQIIWSSGVPKDAVNASMAEAIPLLSSLIQRYPTFQADAPDAFWYSGLTREADWLAVSPETCDVAFNLLQASHGSTVLIPYDTTGQLTVRAQGLGLNPIVVGPSMATQVIQRLFQILVRTGHKVRDGISRIAPTLEPEEAFDLSADNVVCVAPPGVKSVRGPAWAPFEVVDDEALSRSGLVDRTALRPRLAIDRVDAWSTAVFRPRAHKRAVFITSQGILFGRGQEQRLRELWIRDRYPLEQVLTLPQKMYASTTQAPALLVFDERLNDDRVRFTDATEWVVKTSLGGRNSRVLDVDRIDENLRLHDFFKAVRDRSSFHLGAVDRFDPQHDRAQTKAVTREELLSAECSLLPSRYLRAPLQLVGERDKLGDIATVIRSPVLFDEDHNEPEALEVGIPDLGGWRPIVPRRSQPGEQSEGNQPVRVRRKKLVEVALKKGDIVMSIKGSAGKVGSKGSVGRCALIGADLVKPTDTQIAEPSPLVVSGNCIALRLNPVASVSPEYLRMYFASNEFERQIDALLVGSTITHITPDTLCNGILVPRPTPEQHESTLSKYRQLCQLESTMEEAKERINEVVSELWT